ncbi:bcl-2-like protein 12 [Lissotriton helveticus]
MDKHHPAHVMPQATIKEETKHVLEAFLKRSLSQEEGSRVGHVGRAYHDHTKYSHRPARDGHQKPSMKRSPRPSERKGSKPAPSEKEDGTFQNGTWRSIHEEINRVEEKKHGFKTNMKQLLRRHSQTKEKDSPLKSKGGAAAKSHDSLDGVLDEPRRAPGPGDSLKRPKTPNPFLACAVPPSDSMDFTEEAMYGPAPEKPTSLGARRKSSKPFSLKGLLKKKSSAKEVDPKKKPPGSPRPSTLPVMPCYELEHPSGQRPGDIDPGIYNMAAKQLDRLVQQHKVRSPTTDLKGPAFPLVSDGNFENNNNNQQTVPECDKEKVVQQLVALLQEQAEVINKQIEEDPMLRGALSRMSYRSFSRLAEVFTSQAEVPVQQEPNISPELTKIALTMELTRKVAGINSYPVQTLMGYSMQYMDMFVPWLQQQGGWENIVSQEDILD